MLHIMYDLEYIVNVADEVFHKQTGEELQLIKNHFGQSYNELKIVALIATKMFARIAGLKEDPERSISPLDILVDQAIKQM